MNLWSTEITGKVSADFKNYEEKFGNCDLETDNNKFRRIGHFWKKL